MFKTVVLVLGLLVICQAKKPLLKGFEEVKELLPSAADYRLPNNTKPLHYDIELTTWIHDDTNPKQFDFEGKVTISLEVLQESKVITLHHRQLTIVSHQLTGTEDEKIETSRDTEEPFEFLKFTSKDNLKVGKHTLEITYVGKLREDNGGFYRSSYDVAGKPRWLATTQFESTDARHAVPCYDEPGTRATISLTINNGATYTAISNMPMISDAIDPNTGLKVTIFEKTPPMQTYLLAFVISDFNSITDKANNQRVFTRAETEDAKFALEAGVKILNALFSYLNVKYELPKMDQIAIPDFAAGAMENWGLVTYREEALLYNKVKSPMSQMKYVANIIAHEFGHQYFGNHVSPEWWSYLWLNEGFATFFEYHASNIAYPQLLINELFTVEKLHVAFDSDSLESTRPMTTYVETPSAIANLFDNIAYAKSGSVLRMLQHALSDEIFKLGLKYYLDDRKFDTGTPQFLAAGLQKAVDEKHLCTNVLPILTSWSDQKGYPVLHVSRGEDNKITLTQERFLLKSIENAPKTKWWLPYNFATVQQPDFSSTLPNKWLSSEKVEIETTSDLNWNKEEWVIFNKQQTGFYRVNYDENLWNLIIKQLHSETFETVVNLNRASLIDDSMNLARSKRLNYDVPLTLIQYLSKEKNYVPWAAANVNLGFLNRLMAASNKYNLFQIMMLDLINPVYTKLGLESIPTEHLHDKLLRNVAINWACQMGSKDCLQTTTSTFKEIINGSMKADPNLKSTIYCNGLRDADTDVFMGVLKEMQLSKDQDERSLIISSLGCSQKRELLELFLNTSIDDENESQYRSQERSRVLSSVYTNGPLGLDVSMKFLDKNAEKVDETYNAGSFDKRAIGNAVVGMGRRVVNKEQNVEFETLVTKLHKDNYVNDEEVKKSKELVSENLEWVTSHGENVEQWLKDNIHGGASSISISSSIMVVISVFVYLFN